MKKEHPLLKFYTYIRKLFDKPKFSELPEELRVLSSVKYDNYINSFPYKSDKLKGLLDKTSSITHFLDTTSTTDRDCDDYARMWSAWLLYNNYQEVYEIIITEPRYFFSKSHFITIGKKSDRNYVLCNYHMYRNFSSFENALNKMKSSYPNYIYTIYRLFTKDSLEA